MSLKIKDLKVDLDGREILHSINLEIKDGEFFSLLGPSGCGKTTLLKSIAGLLIQNSGSITINDKCLDPLPPEKRDIAVVFQELRLFPNMNVAENVAFPLKMRGVKKKERLQRASEILENVQLAGFEKRRSAQLSGGQQQRVALARALAADPSVLLLDEPFSALDENLRDDMRDLLASLHKQMNTTMVLVTHDQDEALRLSDRIAVMEDGHVLQCDTPKMIYDKPASLEIARYFSDANVVLGKCESGKFTCPLFSANCSLDDSEAYAMIRQAAVSISDTSGNNGNGDNASCSARYEIVRVDYLGDRQRIGASKNGIELEFEAIGQDLYKVGDEIKLSFDEEKILLFPKV